MQLKPEQLDAHLKQGKPLAPLYFITGEATLLAQEARDTLKAAAIQRGHTEVHRLAVETGFQWSELLSFTENLSLFSDKNCVLVNNPSAKFDDSALKILLPYLENPSGDTVLIISSDKLTGAQKRTKWYKAFEKQGAIITVWPVQPYQMPAWIQTRLRTAGLNADRDSIDLLAELTAGNLLATQQAVEKLQLLYPGERITRDKMLSVVSHNARYNVFDLVNYALQGDAHHTITVLDGLKAEGSEPTFILWAITREIRALIGMKLQMEQGTPLATVIAREWQSRKRILQAALNRLSLQQLYSALQQAMQVDHAIKGIDEANVWDGLSRLSLTLIYKELADVA